MNRKMMMKNSKRVTIEFDTEGLAAEFAQSVRASGEVILEPGTWSPSQVECAAEVVEEGDEDV